MRRRRRRIDKLVMRAYDRANSVSRLPPFMPGVRWQPICVEAVDELARSA